MVINGKDIARAILHNLEEDVSLLNKSGVTPTMAVILIGENPVSESYVRQKQKVADSIGAVLKVIRFSVTISASSIHTAIEQYNNDRSVHGIIIQRPLPAHLNKPELLNMIIPSKDVDGFVPNSHFSVPVALAVERIVKATPLMSSSNSKAWPYDIRKKRILILGRGETGGKPIAHYFKNLHCSVSVIHSQTRAGEKKELLQGADIIISCVGKPRVIKARDIKKGVILISVGIWRDEQGKLHGDYDEEEVRDIASFYTPTPGGVGPVNVACLMANLVSSASKTFKKEEV